MLLCFSLQSYRSFKKFLEGKSSLSESDIPRKYEPLPTFSICSEPPFDSDYMKSELNISPNLFLYTSFMNNLDNDFAFPSNLSEHYNSSISLDEFWASSILKPIAFSINGDVIVRDQFDHDANHTEIEKFDMIHSVWYGRCSSFVLSKPRYANENLIMAFMFLG